MYRFFSYRVCRSSCEIWPVFYIFVRKPVLIRNNRLSACKPPCLGRFFVLMWIWPFSGNFTGLYGLGGITYRLCRKRALNRRKGKNNLFSVKM